MEQVKIRKPQGLGAVLNFVAVTLAPVSLLTLVIVLSPDEL